MLWKTVTVCDVFQSLPVAGCDSVRVSVCTGGSQSPVHSPPAGCRLLQAPSSSPAELHSISICVYICVSRPGLWPVKSSPVWADETERVQGHSHSTARSCRRWKHKKWKIFSELISPPRTGEGACSYSRNIANNVTRQFLSRTVKWGGRQTSEAENSQRVLIFKCQVMSFNAQRTKMELNRHQEKSDDLLVWKVHCMQHLSVTQIRPTIWYNYNYP